MTSSRVNTPDKSQIATVFPRADPDQIPPESLTALLFIWCFRGKCTEVSNYYKVMSNDEKLTGQQCLKIKSEGGPVCLDPVSSPVLGHVLLEYGPFERGDGLALADDVQGNPLAHLALTVAVGNQGLVAMSVNINISRCDYSPLSRDGALARGRVDLAHLDNPSPFNRDVAVKPGISSTVNDPSSVNDLS